MISSTKNPQIKFLEKLKKSSKFRIEKGLFVVEGIKSIREAYRSCVVDSLYVSEAWLNAEKGDRGGADTDKRDADGSGILDRLLEEGLLNKHQGSRVEVVSEHVFERISDTVTPQGLLALVNIPEYSFEEILKKPELFLVLLENLSDPGNLGTIIRTAEGAGADALVLGGNCADVFSPKVVRSAMGALFRMPVFVFSNDVFFETLKNLKNNGVRLYGAHLSGALCYDEAVYGNKSGILIGNESKGLSKEISELSDCLVKIPMEGRVESLNASVAAGIMMYEVYRQRRGGSSLN